MASARMIGTRSAAMIVSVWLTCLVGQAPSSKGTPTYYRDVIEFFDVAANLDKRGYFLGP